MRAQNYEYPRYLTKIICKALVSFPCPLYLINQGADGIMLMHTANGFGKQAGYRKHFDLGAFHLQRNGIGHDQLRQCRVFNRFVRTTRQYRMRTYRPHAW